MTTKISWSRGLSDTYKKITDSIKGSYHTAANDEKARGYMGYLMVSGGSNVNATVYRVAGTSEAHGAGSLVRLYKGDIVKTGASGGGDVYFRDGSSLRLDSDTTVSIDVPGEACESAASADGKLCLTISYLIMMNGSNWGVNRSSTGGFSIGTDTLVIGVRG